MKKTDLHTGQKVRLRYRFDHFDIGRYKFCYAKIIHVDPDKRKGILVKYYTSLEKPFPYGAPNDSCFSEKWVTGKSIVSTWASFVSLEESSSYEKQKRDEDLKLYQKNLSKIQDRLSNLGIECNIRCKNKHPFPVMLSESHANNIINLLEAAEKKKKPSRRIV